jgi:hypothetical protein
MGTIFLHPRDSGSPSKVLTSDPKSYEVSLDFGFRVPLDSDEMGFKANHILEFGTLKASFMKKDQNLCPNSQSLFPPISVEIIRNISDFSCPIL